MGESPFERGQHCVLSVFNINKSRAVNSEDKELTGNILSSRMDKTRNRS